MIILLTAATMAAFTLAYMAGTCPDSLTTSSARALTPYALTALLLATSDTSTAQKNAPESRYRSSLPSTGKAPGKAGSTSMYYSESGKSSVNGLMAPGISRKSSLRCIMVTSKTQTLFSWDSTLDTISTCGFGYYHGNARPCWYLVKASRNGAGRQLREVTWHPGQ